MSKRGYLARIYVFLVVFIVSGCNPASYATIYRPPTPTALPATPLTFESVLTTRRSGYNGTEPDAIVVRTIDDFESNLASKDSNFATTMHEIINHLKDTQILVILLREPRPSGAYEIRGRSVFLKDNDLVVYAELCDMLGRPGDAAMSEMADVLLVTLPHEASQDLEVVLETYPFNC